MICKYSKISQSLVLLFILLSLGLTSCDLFANQEAKFFPVIPFVFEGTIPQVYLGEDDSSMESRAATRNPELRQRQIWIVPTVRGNDSPISQYNMLNVQKINQRTNGSFFIPRGLLQFIPGDTFVMVFVDVTEDRPIPLGLVGLHNGNAGSVLELSKNAIIGNIDFGSVTFSGSDIGVSSRSIQSNSTSFTSEFINQALQESVISNASRMVMNHIRNIVVDRSGNHPTIISYFTESISITLNSTHNSQPLNMEEEIHEQFEHSTDLPIESILVMIFSEDSTTKAQLYYPDRVRTVDGNHYYNLGPHSASKWSATFTLQEFLDHVRPGILWPLISDQGIVLAEFDLSAALVIDDLGTPIVPIPVLSYTFENGEEFSFATTLTIDWQYFGKNGSTVYTIPQQSLDRLIGKQELFFQINTIPYATFMFDRVLDEDYSGLAVFDGSLHEISKIEAQLGHEIRRNRKLEQFGYRFGLYNILIRPF